jgi:hypothetical protein
MKTLIYKVFTFIKEFINEHGTSTSDVATGMILMVAIGTIVTISGNEIVLDTEEKIHVFNAQTMANAAQKIINDDNKLAPIVGQSKTFTLQSLYETRLLLPVIDSSSEDRIEYNPDLSTVLIENVVRADIDSGSEIVFFVKLVRTTSPSDADNGIPADYVYLDEVSIIEGFTPVESSELTRDHVDIPARSTDGKG